MDRTETFGVLLIIIGTLMILHHVCLWQRLFDIEDILHHEFFEVIFITAGVTLLISNYNKRRSG
jgi:predicted membrane protein